VEHHLIDDGVVDEPAGAHDFLRLNSELGSAGYVSAQEIAGGDLRNAVPRYEQLSLGSFANTGRP